MAQQEQKQQFQCTGDCLNCIPVQRQYCAAQNAYNNMRALERIERRMATIEEHFVDISKKILSEETRVFNPNKETAEKGDAAKE